MVKKAKQTAANKTAKQKVVGKTKVKKTTSKPKALNAVYKNDNQSFLDKVQTYVKNNTVTSLLVVFLVLGGLVVGVWQFMIYQEKQEFERAEIVLDELANSISDEIGKPLSTAKTKTCGYRSVKFEDPGPPSCSIRVSFVLNESINPDNPSTYVNVAQKVDRVLISNSLVSNSDALVSDIKSLDEYSYGDNYLSSDINLEEVSSLKCYISYGPGDATDFYLSENNLSTLTISCSRKSLTEHFPVVD